MSSEKRKNRSISFFGPTKSSSVAYKEAVAREMRATASNVAQESRSRWILSERPCHLDPSDLLKLGQVSITIVRHKSELKVKKLLSSVVRTLPSDVKFNP